jgi:hypothetical protein
MNEPLGANPINNVMKKNKSPWPLWMDIYGFRFVYHGDWADPEIVWHGYAMSTWYVEEPMWECYCEECNEQGIEQTDEGFSAYCKKNVEQLRDYAQAAIDNGNAYRVKRMRWETRVFSSGKPGLYPVPAR